RRNTHRFAQTAHAGERISQREVKLNIEWTVARQGHRSLEQVQSGTGVVSRQCPASGLGQPLPGAHPEYDRGRCQRREVEFVPVRLLEVVAEDLVQLDEVGTVLLEPVREPFVKLGPRRLREAR